MKRFIAILATSGALAAAGAALAPAAFADPNPNATCTGEVASATHGQLVADAAQGSAGLPGPKFVGLASSSDCGQR
jgi:hypothetical protein